MNLWQRALLTFGGILLLIFTFSYLQEEGFESINWMFPLALAILLFFFSFSGLSSENKRTNRPNNTKSYSANLKGFPSTTQSLMSAFILAKNHLGKNVRLKDHRLGLNDPGFMEQAATIRFKVYTYSFILVTMTADKLDPKFLKSSRYDDFNKQIWSKLTKAWLDSKNLEALKSERDKKTYAQDMMIIPQLQTEIISRFANQSATPFKPLFHFLAVDSDRDFEGLEAELESTTRSILSVFNIGSLTSDS